MPNFGSRKSEVGSRKVDRLTVRDATGAPFAPSHPSNPSNPSNSSHSSHPSNSSHLLDFDLTTRSLTLRAETIDEATRSVDAVLASENPATVYDPDSGRVCDEVLVTRGAALPQQMPLLATHNRYSLDAVLGSIRSIRAEGNQVVGRLYFAEGDPNAERAWQKVRQKHITDVSVGYRSDKSTLIPAGQTAPVDGRNYTAGAKDLKVTTRWTPREGSLVPIGADQSAKIRQSLGHEDRARISEPPKMKKKLRKFLVTLGLRAEATDAEAQLFFDGLTGTQRTEAEALSDRAAPDAPSIANPPSPIANPAAAPTERAAVIAPLVTAPVVDEPAIRAAAATAERTRIARIHELAGREIPQELVTRAVNEGWDESRASVTFLQALRDGRPAPSVGGPAIHAPDRGRDATRDALISGLMLRNGLNPTQHWCEVRLGTPVRRRLQNGRDDCLERIAEQGQQFHDVSLLDMCRHALSIDGVHCGPGRSAVIEALQTRAFSGSSVAGIFTNIFGAMLIASYEDYPDSTQGWTTDSDLPDFKPVERTRLEKAGGLKRHKRGGSAGHIDRSDATESYKLARYTGQLVVDEMDLIDDRFGGLEATTPMEMGEACARLRQDLVYAILLANDELDADSIALFASDHGNLEASNALSANALQKALTDLNTQTENGVALSLFGRYLIVPEALKWTARTIVTAGRTIATGLASTSAASTLNDYNPMADEGIEVRSDPRLDLGVIDPDTETAYAGSATTWFLAARGGRHTIEVGHLRGTGRMPKIRSFIKQEGAWGIGWDVNRDIGAKALDFRGLHKNTA